MKKTQGHRLQIAPDRVSPVPATQLTQFKRSMTERVVKPMQNRAAAQREQVAKVRSRQVR
jgi:hypothetical protein